MREVVIGGMLYVLVFASASVGLKDRDSDDKCRGSDRWEVKVMADEDADQVELSPVDITLEELVSIDTDDNAIGKSTPRQDLEMQVYRVKNVFITKAILENDNDIHLVIEDGQGNHMIAEIPDSDCEITRDSPVEKRFTKARDTFMRYKDIYDQYFFDVTGVFFIDRPHKQTGVAPNNAELHPVIALRKVKKIKLDN